MRPGSMAIRRRSTTDGSGGGTWGCLGCCITELPRASQRLPHGKVAGHKIFRDEPDTWTKFEMQP